MICIAPMLRPQQREQLESFIVQVLSALCYALASSSIDIALQKWEPWFAEENSDPAEIVVNALDRRRSSPGMRNKRLSGCLPRMRANFASHYLTVVAKKAVAYTKRWLSRIESGDNFSQYSQLSRKQTTLGIGKVSVSRNDRLPELFPQGDTKGKLKKNKVDVC